MDANAYNGTITSDINDHQLTEASSIDEIINLTSAHEQLPKLVETYAFFMYSGGAYHDFLKGETEPLPERIQEYRQIIRMTYHALCLTNERVPIH